MHSTTRACLRVRGVHLLKGASVEGFAIFEVGIRHLAKELRRGVKAQPQVSCMLFSLYRPCIVAGWIISILRSDRVGKSPLWAIGHTDFSMGATCR